MQTRRPLIGIVPLVDIEQESYWMLPGYMEGIEQAGGVPVMLPLTDDEEAIERLAETMDGFLFSGGHDVSPELYGEEKLPECAVCCPERDAMERRLLPAALKRNRAVLGICRGIQLINAVLGGTLYQDLPTQHPSPLCHRQKAPYDAPSHEVRIVEGTPLQVLLGKTGTGVNSCHHQAIHALAPCLKEMAMSADGLIEAVYMPEKRFVWAVQWHPEFSYKVNPDSVKIFRAFVSAAQEDGERSARGKRVY